MGVVVALATANLFGAGKAFALDEFTIGEGYASPSFEELTQTFMMMGGRGVEDPLVIDEYARIVYCPVYLEKFQDDFSWNEVRRNLQTNVREKRETYRELYEVIGDVELGRYDFNNKRFPLSHSSEMRNVGFLTVAAVRESTGYQCGSRSEALQYFPYAYMFLLDRPLNIRSLYLDTDAAAKLMEAMTLRDAEDPRSSGKRLAFVRMRLRLYDVAPKDALPRSVSNVEGIRVRVEQVDFFLDRAMTQHILKVPLSTN